MSADVTWLPAGVPPPPAEGPALCPGGFLEPGVGAAVLDAALKEFPDRASWEAYTARARARIQEGAGLAPWPKRTPLRPILHSRSAHDGYSVENVALETVPGFFATGNLYRPLGRDGAYPVILYTHGHSRGITKPEDYATHGRFSASAQICAANLARMGAIVMTIDMFGYGDSIGQVGQEAHRTEQSMPIHIWNGVRALDFLLSLDGADPERVAVTGASGGGTQAFLLTALDPRVKVSVPVVMVSSYFFGGCPCESGRPVHRGADHFVNNTMIAAMAAPRPLLVVSDGKDWTQHAPEIDMPFLKSIYGYYHAGAGVENAHYPEEGHDYGPSKRAAAYRFLAQRLGLELAAVQDGSGAIDESRATVLAPDALHVFDDAHPLPERAAGDARAVTEALRKLQE